MIYFKSFINVFVIQLDSWFTTLFIMESAVSANSWSAFVCFISSFVFSEPSCSILLTYFSIFSVGWISLRLRSRAICFVSSCTSFSDVKNSFRSPAFDVLYTIPQSINCRKFILVFPLEICNSSIISSMDNGSGEIKSKAWICAMALLIPHRVPKDPWTK